MTIESGDPACLEAFTVALGHAPPFTEEELSTIESMTVVHAYDLAPLEACSGLLHLCVLASEVDDFGFCEMLSELVHLEILATKVRSMGGATFCRKLERIDLMYTSVSDAAEVLGVGSFRRGTLIGNPWDSGSWSYLQSECSHSHMFVELPAEHDWKLTRTLWEKEKACWGPIADSYRLLVRPGLPTLTQNAYDALQLTSVRHEMNQPTFSLEYLFREYASLAVAPDLSDLAQSRTLGSSAETQQWIAAAAMSDEDKAALTAFVQRFPEVPFYRASQALIEREAKGEKFTLPAWYNTQRATLDGWLPNAPNTAIRVDRFDVASSPRAARAGVMSFNLGLYPHASQYQDKMLAAGFVNVGMCAEDPEIYLAMRLADGDHQIYDYHFEDISDAISEGRDPASSIYPAFRSFASMLGHVVSLHPQDRDQITAA